MSIIYLTFDDGPSIATPRLLDILDMHNVKATFFITGSEIDAKILKRIIDSGHVIGLHSYTHDYSTIYSSEDAFMSDLRKLEDSLFSVAGISTRLYRFPGGSTNTVSERYCPGIMNLITPKLFENDRLVFDWNCENEDGMRKGLSKEHYFTLGIRSFCHCRSKHKIFLLHNRYYDTSSIESVSLLIPFFKHNGCIFDTLDHYPIDPKIKKVWP